MLQVKIQNTGNLFHLYTYFFISNGGKNEEPQHNCYKSQMVQAGSFYKCSILNLRGHESVVLSFLITF